jgi:hypothetical protein
MSKVSKSLQYQRSIVKNLCSQTISGKYSSEIAASVDDYENDPRVFLGILSFPDENCKKCLMEMRKELSKCFEEDYVLPPRAWHLTIRNIRTISNPPNFSKNDISNLISELDEKIKNIKPIRFSFKDFLYTPTSIGIAAYPDENFNDFNNVMNDVLENINLEDDKKYKNGMPLFSNITLVRLKTKFSKKHLDKLRKFSIDLPDIDVKNLYVIQSNLSFEKKFFFSHKEYDLMK